jgi:sterol desaturase/sphingolipid hydroxylase (fatty acid hydroxylase superfamily)
MSIRGGLAAMIDQLKGLGNIPLVALPVVLFLLLLVVEQLVPLRKRIRLRLPRWRVNLLLSLLVFAAGAWLLRPVATMLTLIAVQRGTGLLGWLNLPPVAAGVLGFLLMDLTFYWWHRVNHQLPLLWRLHGVHHLDPDLDTTTSFRFHAGEIVLSVGFRVVQVLVIGVTPAVYAAYEIVFVLCTIFHHSNIRLPLRVERPLNYLLVTPRMHGVHHSAWQSETNSNYGVVFRCWDTLHRSVRLNVPQDDVEIGVPGYGQPADNRVLPLLAMPLCAQRDYWQAGGVPRIVRDFPATGGPDRMAD